MFEIKRLFGSLRFDSWRAPLLELVPFPSLKKATRPKGRLRKATELRTATPTVYASRAAKGGATAPPKQGSRFKFKEESECGPSLQH